MTYTPPFTTLSLHEYDPQLTREKEYWDACVTLSDKSLSNFFRHLIRFHGEMHCSYVISGGGTRLGSINAHMRINLPKGTAERFMLESGVNLTPLEVVSGN
jgi:hypothetical protein